jgi:uncharacterized membrane-anchored protein
VIKEAMIDIVDSSKAREEKGRHFDADELLKNLKPHGKEHNDMTRPQEEVRHWSVVKWLVVREILMRNHSDTNIVLHVLQVVADQLKTPKI